MRRRGWRVSSGASVFDATWTTPTSKIALSGTAGFALFFVVYFFYDKVFRPDDAMEFNIPAGANFRQALDTAAQLATVTVDYQVLDKRELAAEMVPGHLSCNTFEELLDSLRLRTKSVGAVRAYSVSKNKNIYRLAR